MMNSSTDKRSHVKNVQRYYRFHAWIYDLTRWTFLFGRKALIKEIPALPSQPRILEIGCGTGYNLKRLQDRFPNAQITGIDLSSDMLRIAKQRLKQSTNVKLIHANYFSLHELDSFDLILLSYSLTIFGDNPQQMIANIIKNLKPKGYLAAVDFNTSPFAWFRRWMRLNHVDLSGQFLPLLQQACPSGQTEIHPAYSGLWSYFVFVGQRQ